MLCWIGLTAYRLGRNKGFRPNPCPAGKLAGLDKKLSKSLDQDVQVGSSPLQMSASPVGPLADSSRCVPQVPLALPTPCTSWQPAHDSNPIYLTPPTSVIASPLAHPLLQSEDAHLPDPDPEPHLPRLRLLPAPSAPFPERGGPFQGGGDH